jgi:hypothetical protein
MRTQGQYDMTESEFLVHPTPHVQRQFKHQAQRHGNSVNNCDPKAPICKIGLIVGVISLCAALAEVVRGPRSGFAGDGDIRGAIQQRALGVDDGCKHVPAVGRFVTAISSNHFEEAYGMVRTAQEQLPLGWSIVVYDLIGDLSAKEVATIRAWCHVEYRLFDVAGFELDARCEIQTVPDLKLLDIVRYSSLNSVLCVGAFYTNCTVPFRSVGTDVHNLIECATLYSSTMAQVLDQLGLEAAGDTRATERTARGCCIDLGGCFCAVRAIDITHV